MKIFAISDLHLSVNNPKPMDIFGPVWDGYLDKIFSQWKDNVKDIVEGQKLQGIIRETSKDKRGLFIELKPNLVGMAEYKPNYEYGEKVKVIVKRIIPEKEKIKLKIVKENAVNRDTSC